MKKYLALPISIMVSNLAMAQGYYLDEQSAKRLGDAFSGGAAEASDASTAFYNPAGLARLKQDELLVNIGAVMASTEVKDPTLTPTIQGEDISKDTTSVIPSVYYAKRADEISTLAAYINAPYATGVNFGDDSLARYQSVNGKTVGIDLGLMVGVELTKGLSIGGGVVFQYLQANVEKAVNLSAVCAGQLGATCTSALSLPLDGSTATDATFSMEGGSVATGFNLGVLYEYSDTGRVGLGYRSKIRHELKGDAEFDMDDVNAPAKVFAAAANLATTKASGSASMTTPETISLSVHHGLGDLGLQADVTYTSWSDFDQLKIESTDAVIKQLAGEPEAYEWEDTFRYSIGAYYNINNSFTVRTGVAMDESPIPDENTKVDLAMGDFTALSLGGTYSISKDLAVDFAVQQTMIADRDLNQSGAGSTLAGEIENSATSVAVGMNWKI